MADYGGRGFVMILPYLIGLLVGAGIAAIFDLTKGAALMTVLILTIVIGQILKAVINGNN